MGFGSEKEAKDWAFNVTTCRFEPHEIASKLSQYKHNVKIMPDDADKEYWHGQYAQLKAYAESEEFIDGRYPQGLDKLFCELVEFRATIYAYEQKPKGDEFLQSFFFQHWQLGASYAVTCIIGKLVSTHKDDYSLVKLWKEVAPFVEKTELLGAGEAQILARKLDKSVRK